MLVLLTDGRANVTSSSVRTVAVGQDNVRAEIEQLGAALVQEGVASVVIDSKARFVSSGEGASLAEALGGRYIYLRRADSSSIHRAVVSSSPR